MHQSPPEDPMLLPRRTRCSSPGGPDAPPPEDPMLLSEIRDQIVLVAVHPASERENEEL